MASDFSAGVLTAKTLPPGGAPFTLSVPAEHDAEKPTPLVVSLHYGGPAPPYYGRGLLEGMVEPALRALGAIMIAPDCPGPAWAAGDCERNVLQLLDHIQEMFNIDTSRILLTGYSKGGIGTWALAARYPDRFSAAVVMAGQPPPDLVPEDWKLPLYVIHAEEDEILSISPVTRGVDALRDAGATVEYLIVNDVTHFETHRFTPLLRKTVPWLQSIWAQD